MSRVWQGGAQIGAGAGAASALHSVLSRVVCARGANGALAALRAVCGVWRRDADAGHAYDLQATLLRLALPMLQVLSPRHVHHALPLMLTVGQCLPFLPYLNTYYKSQRFAISCNRECCFATLLN